ncbi:MAG: hypothetical protein JZU67_07870, partial [Burkholderiaceae bacterium]|nr:hypothetical protein [Burkholderiaceae bacterium]
FTHDLARLQYTYTVLYSVASALWREVFNHDEACSWPYLIEYIKHFVGTFSETMYKDGAVQTKTNPWNLKSEIALTAVLVSKLYEEAMKKNHNTTANAIETELRPRGSTFVGFRTPVGDLCV